MIVTITEQINDVEVEERVVAVVETSIAARGPRGYQGEPGPAGEQGPQGEPGEQGPAGATGPVGPPGETGPAGPTGATGATGATGPKGDKGDTGEQGEAGPQGETGPKGEPGEPGLIQSIQAGDNITIDDTDPASPVISATGGGGGGTSAIEMGKFAINTANNAFQTDSTNGSTTANGGNLTMTANASALSYTQVYTSNSALNPTGPPYPGSWWKYDFQSKYTFGLSVRVTGASVIFGTVQTNWQSTNQFNVFRGIYAEITLGSPLSASTMKTVTSNSSNSEVQTNTVDLEGYGTFVTIVKTATEVKFYFNGELIATHTQYIMTDNDYFGGQSHYQTYAAITNNSTNSLASMVLMNAETTFFLTP